MSYHSVLKEVLELIREVFGFMAFSHQFLQYLNILKAHRKSIENYLLMAPQISRKPPCLNVKLNNKKMTPLYLFRHQVPDSVCAKYVT